MRTGALAYFDSEEITIHPDHVMASAALPPGFPSIEIDGEHYWDGGLVSNTPLQYALDYYPRRSRLCFQVDVFHSYGPLPKTLEDVSEREKVIRYSSRTRVSTDAFQHRHEVRHAINEMHKILPNEIGSTDQAKRLYAFGCVTETNIIQLLYRPSEAQGLSKDYEFSRTTMNARWKQGFLDTVPTLRAAPWLAQKPREVGVRVFDVMHDILVARNLHNVQQGSTAGDRTITPPSINGASVERE